MEETLIIPPQGRRKHKIILKASFNQDCKKGGELDLVIAKTLGAFKVF